MESVHACGLPLSLRRRLAAEQLESRKLLAVCVVTVIDGELVLASDNDANQIAIVLGAAADEFILRSAATDFGSGPGVAHSVQGVTGDVTVLMGDADDVLEVGELDHALSLPTDNSLAS